MRMETLGRALLRILALAAVLAAFAALDWYPTVAALGRLRLERNEIERKTREHALASFQFTMPDEEEEEICKRSEAELFRSLPLEKQDGDWLALVMSENRTRMQKDGIRSARGLLEPPDPGDEHIETKGVEGRLSEWLIREQADALAEAFALAAGPEGNFWLGVFAGWDSNHKPRPACRSLAVALAAPLPALLNFINHVSWGDARLQVVRLRLQPGVPAAHAWVVVRGYFLSESPSQWQLRREQVAEDDLLIDRDSPLLWQKVDPEFIHRQEKHELAPAGSPFR